MWADDPAILGRRFAQSQKKAVVDIRQAEARALTAAIVHENLERRHTELASIASNAGELRFRRYDEVIAKIDARARFGDVPYFIEHRLEWIGRHQIRNERGDAANRGGRSF